MRNILVFLGGIAVLVIAAVGLYQWLGQPEVAAPPAVPQASAPAASGGDAKSAAEVRAGDFVIGQPSAPVTVIEYASLTCPHCRSFHEDVLPRLRSEYIDTGKVKLVYRDFPLDGMALRASMLARCAGRERFFGFLDLLFKQQRNWATAEDPVAALRDLAAQGGMDAREFEACLANPRIEKEVLEQRLEAEKAFSVNSTPSFIVNGRKMTAAATFEGFKRVIDPLLAAGN